MSYTFPRTGQAAFAFSDGYTSPEAGAVSFALGAREATAYVPPRGYERQRLAWKLRSGYELPEATAANFALLESLGDYAPPRPWAGEAIDWALAEGYEAPAADAVAFGFDAGGEVVEPPPELPIKTGLNTSYGMRYREAADRNISRAAAFAAYRRVDRAAHSRQRNTRSRPAASLASGWDRFARAEGGAPVDWRKAPATPNAATRPEWLEKQARDRAKQAGWDGSIDPRTGHPADAWIVPPEKDRARRAPWFSVDVWGAPYEAPDETPREVDELAQLAWTFASGYAPPAAVAADFALTADYVPPRRGEAERLDALAWALSSGYTTPTASAADFTLSADYIPPRRGGRVVAPEREARPIQPRQGWGGAPWEIKAPQDNGDTLPWGPLGRQDSIGIDIDYPQEPGEPPPEPPPLPDNKRVYLLMPSITAERAADGLPILINAARVSTDRDSWCWQFSATCARREDWEALAPTAAGPAELVLTINGRTWRFLVERHDRERAHNSSSFQISGRSVSAELAAPYAQARTRTESTERLAQQLAAAELEFSGWQLDWQAEDWLVPAGTWSYNELTPLQAIRRLAEAVGAVIHSAPAERKLVVAPRYPVSPWSWADATPDAILPDYLMTRFGHRWEAGAPYNAVYVSGETQGGVLVHVGRAGTGQDSEAPMVVDSLITTRLAGRERGRQVLAEAGNRARVPITTLLLPEPEAPGMIEPGQLVEVRESGETWVGQAMSLSIEASRQNAASVRQVIEVERYYG